MSILAGRACDYLFFYLFSNFSVIDLLFSQFLPLSSNLHFSLLIYLRFCYYSAGIVMYYCCINFGEACVNDGGLNDGL